MTNFRNTILALAATLAFANTNAFELKVASGECTATSCSTYVQMWKQLKNRCDGKVPGLTLSETTSTGSVMSVDLLINNEVNAIWVQPDVMFWKKRFEDMSNFFTLVNLHPEEVHIVSLRGSGNKTGGVLGFGAKTVEYQELADLAGKSVGVVEGSGAFITARVIKSEGQIDYNIVTAKNTDALRALLNEGKVQAIIMVGGARLPAIEELGQEYKLLAVGKAQQDLLKDIYTPASLTYPKMDSNGVSTVSTNAAMVVRMQSNPANLKILKEFKACVDSAIPEIAGQIGTPEVAEGEGRITKQMAHASVLNTALWTP